MNKKAFDKIRYPFQIKEFWQTRNRKELPQPEDKPPYKTIMVKD